MLKKDRSSGTLSTEKRVQTKSLKIVLGASLGAVTSLLLGITILAMLWVWALNQGFKETPSNSDFLGLVYVESSEHEVSATIGQGGLLALFCVIVIGAAIGALVCWVRYRSDNDTP